MQENNQQDIEQNKNNKKKNMKMSAFGQGKISAQPHPTSCI